MPGAPTDAPGIRRHLACEVGEAYAALQRLLADGGFSAEQARRADIDQLAAGVFAERGPSEDGP